MLLLAEPTLVSAGLLLSGHPSPQTLPYRRGHRNLRACCLENVVAACLSKSAAERPRVYSEQRRIYCPGGRDCSFRCHQGHLRLHRSSPWTIWIGTGLRADQDDSPQDCGAAAIASDGPVESLRLLSGAPFHSTPETRPEHRHATLVIRIVRAEPSLKLGFLNQLQLNHVKQDVRRYRDQYHPD